jgi:hypothetical protein
MLSTQEAVVARTEGGPARLSRRWPDADRQQRWANAAERKPFVDLHGRVHNEFPIWNPLVRQCLLRATLKVATLISVSTHSYSCEKIRGDLQPLSCEAS